MLKNIFTLVVIFSCMNTFANEKGVGSDSAAKSLAEKILNLTTYQADFEQRVHNEVGKEIDLTSGEFLIEKPNRFRWQIKQQYEQLIVADGDHIFTYDPDLEQVTIQNQNQLIADSPLLFLTSNAQVLEDSFEISEVKLDQVAGSDNKSRRLFSLLPKGEGGVFEKVHILFDNNRMIELLMADTLGQQTSVKFSNIRINQPVEVSLFSFVIPEGVDVVDSREKLIDSSDASEGANN